MATIRRSFRPAPVDRESLAPLVVEHALDAVIVSDSHGVILDWNRRAETLLGWSREDVLGQTLSATIVPLRYRDAHERGLWVQRETGHGAVLARRVEIEASRRDGSEIPIELSITALGAGRQARFIGFIRDLTGQRNAEEQRQVALEELAASEHKLKLALAAARGGVWEWTAVDRRIRGDARWAKIWGLGPEPSGWSVGELLAKIVAEDRKRVAFVDESGRPIDIQHQRLRLRSSGNSAPTAIVNLMSVERSSGGEILRLVGITQLAVDHPGADD